MNRNRQSGMSTVEFALVSAVLMSLLIGMLEVGRASFVYAAMDEVTRRGARLAAVCPVGDPAIRRLAIFNGAGDTGTSGLVTTLAPENIVVEYLDQDAGVIVNPADAASFVRIRYVRVRVVGFRHTLNIPFLAAVSTFTMPEFAAVLPRESLGVPRTGAITPC